MVKSKEFLFGQLVGVAIAHLVAVRTGKGLPCGVTHALEQTIEELAKVDPVIGKMYAEMLNSKQDGAS